MSFAFGAKQGLVMVDAEVVGPAGSALVKLALDTGATQTVIDSAILVSIGYKLSQATSHSQLTVANGPSLTVPIIKVANLKALGIHRSPMKVLAHSMPKGVFFDGVLGLDYFRGRVLKIDFQRHQIDVS